MFKKTAALLLFLSIPVLTADAQAFNRVHPAVMCKQSTGGSPVVTTEGSVYNSHGSSDLTLVCPIVRTTWSEDLVSATIRVHDQHQTEGVVVSARCRSPSGPEFYAQTATTLNTGDYLLLTFGALSTVLNGACFFHVVVPDFDVAASYVISYVTEFETD